MWISNVSIINGSPGWLVVVVVVVVVASSSSGSSSSSSSSSGGGDSSSDSVLPTKCCEPIPAEKVGPLVLSLLEAVSINKPPEQ